MKRGDTRPMFRGQIQDLSKPEDDRAVDLSAVSQARLLITYSDGTVLSELLTVENQTTNKGWVNRPWVAGETDLGGNHKVEVEVLWNDGSKQTFPPDTHGQLILTQDNG